MEKVREEIKEKPLSERAEGEIPCKKQIKKLQDEMFVFNNEKIFPIVGEIT